MIGIYLLKYQVNNLFMDDISILYNGELVKIKPFGEYVEKFDNLTFLILRLKYLEIKIGQKYLEFSGYYVNLDTKILSEIQLKGDHSENL
jgi:hypothetical protein